MKRVQPPSCVLARSSLAAIVAAVCMTAVTAQAQPAAGSAASGAMGAHSSMPGHGSEQMHKSMMSGMGKVQQMKPTGDTDKDFAMMMKMRHQQALGMAGQQIEHGKSAELKAMARKIVKDQTKEIAQLDAWIKKQP